MNERVYLGIDVGKKGFLALNKGDNDFEFYSIEDNDAYKLGDIMSDIKLRYPNVVCVIEQVHALYGSSASSTFQFGETNGLLKGLLIANKISYHLVQPKAWQKEMWDNKDVVFEYTTISKKDGEHRIKKVATKATSTNAAKRIFPMIDFRRTERCKNLDDNKIDATLLSEYGRRKNL